MKKIDLKDDNFCFVCGKENAQGLKIDFILRDEQVLFAEFIPGRQHQGYAGLVHGGIIGLILDEAMVNLLWKLGKKAVTVEYQIRLKKVAYIGHKLIFKAGIESAKKRIVHTYGTCENEQGEVVAVSTAKCMYV